MPAAQKIITFNSVSLGYGNNHNSSHSNSRNDDSNNNLVIKDATFAINSGSFVCIVGANGSGKSTLIKGILGLLKPLSGTINLSLPQNQIGYLPQENHISQIFPATVEEVVRSGLLGQMGRRPFYQKSEKLTADKYLKELNIAPLAKKSFSSLSGGQKQKVLLARALVATSRLLILDEPSNNLDHASRQDFYATLRRLHQKGLTILMITHDLDQDDLIGDQVLALSNGRASLSSTKSFLRSFRP